MECSDKTMFDRKKYNREWLYNKRHGLPTRTTPKLNLTDEDRKIRKNQRNEKSNDKRQTNRKAKLIQKFGKDYCPIDGQSYRMQLHRKDGVPHKKWQIMTNAEFDEVIQSDEYILVCYWCHKHIHWCMRYMDMIWSEIKLRLKL
jgi:hypothetical protein